LASGYILPGGRKQRVTDSLGGATVALLEARMESELASLVRRHGGAPLCVPALREVERDCSAESALAVDAAGRDGAVVVLATGVGLARWMAVAAAQGRDAELRAALSRATVVCRGPKPVAVLKREGLAATLRAEPPHTTTELLRVLEGVEVRGHDVAMVHDGSTGSPVPPALRTRGAAVVEVRPYEWALPADVAPLQELVRSIVAGRVRAIAVTTQVQARHLFDVASALGLREPLAAALRDRVIVAAVGPTCARTLTDLGAPPHVMPENAKMGPLVASLAKHLAQ
jgi:uroporphyrinogen-III synthase